MDKDEEDDKVKTDFCYNTFTQCSIDFVHETSMDYWERVVPQIQDEQQQLEDFRMTEALSWELQRCHINVRAPLSIHSIYLNTCHS